MMQARSYAAWPRRILAVLLLLVWVTHCAAPRADVSVSIYPDWLCAEHEEVLRVFLWVDMAGSEFDGYETTIRFDPDYLTFVAVREESLMTDPPGGTWWRTEVTDSTVFISHVLLSGGIGITGPGALSSIDFCAAAATGETPIRFGDTFFYRIGEYVPTITHGGLAYITNDCGLAACCLESNECVLLDPDSCATVGGTWHPTWPTCDPNPCLWAGVTTALSTQGTHLSPPRPNPTHESTLLLYYLAVPGDVVLEVFDAGGRCVSQVYRGTQTEGFGAMKWSGRNAAGTPVPMGTYFCRLTVGGQAWTQRVMVLR